MHDHTSVNRDRLCTQCQGSLDDREPQRVVTVRMPKSLHQLLKAQAHETGTSMNRLCLERLADSTAVPPDEAAPADSDPPEIPARLGHEPPQQPRGYSFFG